MPAGAEGNRARDGIIEVKLHMHCGLDEQVIGADVADKPLATGSAFITDVLVGTERLGEPAERTPIELAGLIDTGLGQRLQDQLVGFVRLVVIVARKDDGRETGP